MQHTHPQYRLAVECLGGPLRTSSHTGMCQLDEALIVAARFNAAMVDYGWDDQHYYVEPVPGTEPRYTLMVSGPNRQGAVLSWPYCVSEPWAVVKDAYEERTSLYGQWTHGSGWPLTYTVVPA